MSYLPGTVLRWTNKLHTVFSSITRTHKKVVQVQMAAGWEWKCLYMKRKEAGMAERINRIPVDPTKIATITTDFKFCFVMLFETEMYSCYM